jgi:hypothetical protein
MQRVTPAAQVRINPGLSGLTARAKEAIRFGLTISLRLPATERPDSARQEIRSGREQNSRRRRWAAK